MCGTHRNIDTFMIVSIASIWIIVASCCCCRSTCYAHLSQCNRYRTGRWIRWWCQRRNLSITWEKKEVKCCDHVLTIMSLEFRTEIKRSFEQSPNQPSERVRWAFAYDCDSNHKLTCGIWISCLIFIFEYGCWYPVGDNCDVFPSAARNACTANCRWRIICSFLARSRLYIGPNLFLPPRIRSARTAETERQSNWLIRHFQSKQKCSIQFERIFVRFGLHWLVIYTESLVNEF